MSAATQGFFPEVGPPRGAPENNQHWGTPRIFLDAVARRFGPIGLDLAAKEDNCVVPAYFGAGSPFEIEDTLSPLARWDDWVEPTALRWLNPAGMERGWYARNKTSDRLRLLGNACVPQQAFLAWETLIARAWQDEQERAA